MTMFIHDRFDASFLYPCNDTIFSVKAVGFPTAREPLPSLQVIGYDISRLYGYYLLVWGQPMEACIGYTYLALYRVKARLFDVLTCWFPRRIYLLLFWSSRDMFHVCVRAFLVGARMVASWVRTY